MVLRSATIILVADILVGYAWSGKTGRHVTLFTGAWLLLSAAGLYAASRPESRLLDRGTRLLTMFAWLAPILALQMLLWKPWDVRPVLQSSISQPRPGNRTPVFLILFDEWSYQRSYTGNQLRPFFRNLRQVVSHSLEFNNAHSLAGATNPSVPRMIFQSNGLLQPKNGVALWKQGDSVVESAKLPSIFTAARDRGYRTSLIGFYFPYRSLLGAQVDEIVHQAYAPKGQRLWRRMALNTSRNLHFLADPLSRTGWKRSDARSVTDNWVYINHEWRDVVRDLIRRSDANTFAMIHWPLPHGPFVLNEDGSSRGPFKHYKGTPEDYQRHLALVDRVFGEAVAELDSAKLLDRSLLIVTSDHSWKTDPDSAMHAAPDAQTWVPLIVKLPYQKVGHQIAERFCMGQLGALLQRVMDTTLTEREAPGELEKLPVSASCARGGGLQEDEVD
jgi:hypothetical protein